MHISSFVIVAYIRPINLLLFQVLPVLHNPSHEQIGIFSPRVLSSGQKYFLYIEFGAELAEGFYGFYKSTYRTSTGETRWDQVYYSTAWTVSYIPTSVFTKNLIISILRTLASTHFEPTSARMAFPCFDEPSFKANFSVRIRRRPEYISLSNMPVVSVAYVPVVTNVQMKTKQNKSTSFEFLWFSDQNSWSQRWLAWGPVCSKCTDEYLPRGVCHLWL